MSDRISVISHAIAVLKQLADVDYEVATDEELQALVGTASETINHAEAERRWRREDRS
jgi:hypothetical protein